MPTLNFTARCLSNVDLGIREMLGQNNMATCGTTVHVFIQFMSIYGENTTKTAEKWLIASECVQKTIHFVLVLVVPSRRLIIIASLQMEECSWLSRGLPASSGQEISGEGGGGGCLCVPVCVCARVLTYFYVHGDGHMYGGSY